jgi:NTE family protein
MRRRILALLALGIAATAAAEESAPASPRPKIGLALGGGGARGAAHIGVLKELERMHIQVDYVAGTSMGSIIGSLYASGLSVERIEKEFRERDWSAILSDRAPYRDLVWRRKQDDGNYLLDLEMGLRKGKLQIPTGLRAGQKLGFELQALLLPVSTIDDFGQLPIPFRAVATDVETGERVVLDHGDLVQSVVASMTVPGVFAPVEIDGRLLVDGGMANNLPVEVVRAMGADVVIAVDVGTPLSTRKEIQSFLGVTNQAFTFLTTRNSNASAKLADIVIRPELSGISSSDFGDTAEAIERGEAAIEGKRAAIERLARSEDAFAAWSARRQSMQELPPAVIASVRVEGNERVDMRVVEAYARLQPGDPLEVARLRDAVRRVYGRDDFQRVRFGLEGDPVNPGVVLRVQEKPWGPTYLHFGLEAVDDLQGDASYGVKANATRTDCNALGGEWRTDARIGSSPGVRTEFFQPLDFSGKLFVAPWVQFLRQRTPLYDEDTGDRIAYYAVESGAAEVDLGVEYGRFGEVRFGAYRGVIQAFVDTGAADLPRFDDLQIGGLALDAAYDTLDRPSIPHRGVQARLRGRFSREGFGASDSYDRLEFGVVQFVGFGRHTLFGSLSAGGDLGSEIPLYDEFTLGGLLTLGGYAEDELRGAAYRQGGIGYHYRLFQLPQAFGEGIYAGALFEAGNTWDRESDISWNDLRYGGTVIVGADTILGPLFFAYGRAEGGKDRFYVTLGRTL